MHFSAGSVVVNYSEFRQFYPLVSLGGRYDQFNSHLLIKERFVTLQSAARDWQYCLRAAPVLMDELARINAHPHRRIR